MNEKHLEFIQGVINRHNSNSFMIKGWIVTIVAAIFALAGTIKDPYLTFIALGPIIMFWVLDSIFLANERCFVSLYMCVVNNRTLHVKNKKIKKKNRLKRTASDGSVAILPEDEVELKTSDFSMNFMTFRKIKRNNWYSVLFSYTIIWFYSMLIVLTFLGFFGMKTINKPAENKKIEVITTIANDTLKIKQIQPNIILPKDSTKTNLK